MACAAPALPDASIWRKGCGQSSGVQGRGQIEQWRSKWQVPRFDLMQVHNLLDWQEHQPTRLAMK